ncbi:MAG TPA: hypothetical protein VHB79_06235 [Polyangiaceae bacterium]|jgi:hypothetical protein|nr:hypothetical protein [Polyangiaceae bacterium]
MASDNLSLIERRVRRKYEWARARRAFWGFTPVLLIVAAAAALAKRPGSTLTFGALMFALGVAALWYGRDVRKAVLPGVALGLIPLVLALCANHMHHVCMGDACMSVCLPACTAGGLVAGIGMAIVGQRQRLGVGYWLAASAITLLTGAMGCSCVGYAGVLGLAAGFGVGLLPALARKLLR